MDQLKFYTPMAIDSLALLEMESRKAKVKSITETQHTLKEGSVKINLTDTESCVSMLTLYTRVASRMA